jgi:hypothetical protein
MEESAMADDDKKPTAGQPEYRSIGAALGQFLSDAQHRGRMDGGRSNRGRDSGENYGSL